MLSKIFGSALIGMDSHTVQVEVDVTGGLPAFEIAGLPDAGIKESRIRVKSAIRNSCYKFPGQRIHVNLAPAECTERKSVSERN